MKLNIKRDVETNHYVKFDSIVISKDKAQCFLENKLVGTIEYLNGEKLNLKDGEVLTITDIIGYSKVDS